MQAMKIQTVTGETVKLSRFSGLTLNFVSPCGHDWVADVSLMDGKIPKNNRRARVYVSKHPGVAVLMGLAMNRKQLLIK